MEHGQMLSCTDTEVNTDSTAFQTHFPMLHHYRTDYSRLLEISVVLKA